MKSSGAQKKLGLEIINYLSNEFKSVIDKNNGNIESLSEMLIPETDRKKKFHIPVTMIGKNKDQAYIHSTMSFNSSKKIQEQLKRGKLLALANQSKKKE